MKQPAILFADPGNLTDGQPPDGWLEQAAATYTAAGQAFDAVAEALHGGPVRCRACGQRQPDSPGSEGPAMASLALTAHTTASPGVQRPILCDRRHRHPMFFFTLSNNADRRSPGSGTVRGLREHDPGDRR